MPTSENTRTQWCETCQDDTLHIRDNRDGWAPAVAVCENYDGAPDAIPHLSTPWSWGE